MISEDFIKTLANKYQTTELNIRREYFQHLFLSFLYKQPASENIFFKGGTALRIIYQSPRFSEDLDFSSSLQPKTIENILTDTLENMEKENIKVSLVEAKTTSGGYLAIINFGGMTIHLEISLRQKGLTGSPVTIVSDFTPVYTLTGLKKEELISQKIEALVSRQKARDFYDLYFVLRANLLPSKEKNILPQISLLLKKTQIDFDKELKLFLPKSHWPVIRNFKETFSSEIALFLPN